MNWIIHIFDIAHLLKIRDPYKMATHIMLLSISRLGKKLIAVLNWAIIGLGNLMLSFMGFESILSREFLHTIFAFIWHSEICKRSLPLLVGVVMVY